MEPIIISIIDKVIVSMDLDFIPLFDAGFESDLDDDVDDEVLIGVLFEESVVDDVVESESASLNIFASGEFGGRFKIPEKDRRKKAHC